MDVSSQHVAAARPPMQERVGSPSRGSERLVLVPSGRELGASGDARIFTNAAVREAGSSPRPPADVLGIFTLRAVQPS
jgi:hypothetical protein